MEDKRFSHVKSDKRFKRIPYTQRKVKIDKRFQSMFTDKRFQSTYEVDERGRPINEKQSDNYKKYYDVSDDTDDSDDSESSVESVTSQNSYPKPDVTDLKTANTSEQIPQKAKNHLEERVGQEIELKEEEVNKNIEKLKEAHKEINKFVDKLHKSKLNENIKEKLTDVTVDYARGIGTLLSESSSDEETSEDEDPLVTIEHPWGELDKDAEETDEITHRLAICNMDWDRVTAKDLIVLFNSFLPSDGLIESVTIYPSEFGIARMAEEEFKGPKELVENGGAIVHSDEEDEDMEEGSALQIEKLREYQLKRLKYYYAVLVCNSSETANMLYTECDGIEYESSAMKLDLRFIPDDTTFDEEPHDVCTVLPDFKKYKPRLFRNTALQQGKVNLTWDETDPNRIDLTRKLLAGEDVDENDLHAYVASQSSSDNEEDINNDVTTEVDDELKKGDEDKIQKYRTLMASLHDADSKKRGGVEMEVSWGVGSAGKEEESAIKSSEDSDQASESESDESRTKRKSRKKKNSKHRKGDKDALEEKERNAELELLLADDDPDETGKKHFNLKEIQKEEKQIKKKRKWRKQLKKKDIIKEQDNTFKIDVQDERFSAIFGSHHFNIDPADPHFRKTKAMEELITEKQKRRKKDL